MPLDPARRLGWQCLDIEGLLFSSSLEALAKAERPGHPAAAVLAGGRAGALRETPAHGGETGAFEELIYKCGFPPTTVYLVEGQRARVWRVSPASGVTYFHTVPVARQVGAVPGRVWAGRRMVPGCQGQTRYCMGDAGR